ncbi:hypothetical protein Y032_0038g3640 [Ancylostoma ceylanicum]|uniref:Uncharacterized protein n=1 Tax=Ancylostoma ceylanicum TaxID=53326 RepID=A0A016UJN8_9BILA|nr:hypothetical protein Y032_0038g3640 [Ancylostoma ceylanicum]
MLIASDNWQRSICFSEKFSRSIIITEHFRALDQCYLVFRSWYGEHVGNFSLYHMVQRIESRSSGSRGERC